MAATKMNREYRMQKSELKIGEANPALRRSYDYIEIKNVQKQGGDG
jgi:hypothetical protein